MRLTDFLLQLQALKDSLNSVNRTLSHLSNDKIYYRVVDLSNARGARVVIEPVTKDGDNNSLEDIQSLHDRFFKELTDISSDKPPSEEIDNAALRSFQKLVEKRGKSFTSATLHNSAAKVALDDTFKTRIATLIEREFFSYGAITGQLGRIAVHRRSQKFWVYPEEFGAAKVLCHFQPGIKEKAKLAIEKLVTVRGKKYYRPNAHFPYRIDVSDLDEVSVDTHRKHLADLGGMAPDATGDKTAIEFITDLRDEWT